MVKLPDQGLTSPRVTEGLSELHVQLVATHAYISEHFRFEERSGNMVAPTRNPSAIGAVVSRSGRPDLARAFLPVVRAPTLLIVGGNDDVLIELNEQVLRSTRTSLRSETKR
jgi:hypothetical protein